MALHEIYIGTQGPFLIDDTDPEYVLGTQVATVDHIAAAEETTATIKAKLGITILSGDNTGDETTGSIKAKIGSMAAITDADITTVVAKFNTLLAELRTLGILS